MPGLPATTGVPPATTGLRLGSSPRRSGRRRVQLGERVELHSQTPVVDDPATTKLRLRTTDRAPPRRRLKGGAIGQVDRIVQAGPSIHPANLVQLRIRDRHDRAATHEGVVWRLHGVVEHRLLGPTAKVFRDDPPERELARQADRQRLVEPYHPGTQPARTMLSSASHSTRCDGKPLTGGRSAVIPDTGAGDHHQRRSHSVRPRSRSRPRPRARRVPRR